MRLLARVFGEPFESLLVCLKVEEPIIKQIIDVEATRVYIPELMKEINSTTERGEHPKLLTKLTKREKTGKHEVEIVFLGGINQRHIEELSYYGKHPMTWKTWGEIVLTLNQAKELVQFLSEIVQAIEPKIQRKQKTLV